MDVNIYVIDKQLGSTETLHRNRDPRKVDPGSLPKFAQFKVKMKGWSDILSRNESHLSFACKFNILLMYIGLHAEISRVCLLEKDMK